ncbi:MAG TPA: hypothetical protein VGK19_18130 [Capsulimonadaceae bacterium]|jgi:hypothetical protein
MHIQARDIDDAVRAVVNGQRLPVEYNCRPGEVIRFGGENYRVRDTFAGGVNLVNSSDVAPIGSNEPDRVIYRSYDALRVANAYYVAVIVIVDCACA